MRFYMIDRITEWKPGKHAKGIKTVSMSEDYFKDHFPKHPIMPGMLILEALAQLSGLLLETTAEKKFKLKIKALIMMLEKVKFRQIASPGDSLELNTRIISIKEDSGKVEVAALVKKKVIAEASMLFVFKQLDDKVLEEKRSKLLSYWLKDIK